MQLRAATAEDAPRMREIVRATYSKYVERMGRETRPMTQDYAEVVEELDAEVAEIDGNVVGLLVLETDPDHGLVIDNVAVHPDHLGTGVGRRLLERAEEKAREQQREEIVLYTHSMMTENLALYSRIGYVEYGREPSPPAEIVFMRKSLG